MNSKNKSKSGKCKFKAKNTISLINMDRQAHNLKVVGSNPTPPATNYINKINYLNKSQELRFLVFFLRFKPDNDYRVINKVINVRQVYLPFFIVLIRSLNKI